MSTTPLDVIMLVHNVQDLAAHAIMHLIATATQPLRFIIVDNGSDPPVEPRLRPWLGDRHVYIRHEANRGVYKPTNEALARCESDLVVWCSTDHFVYPCWFPPIVLAMEQHGLVWASPEYVEEGPYGMHELWDAMAPREQYAINFGQLGASCFVLNWKVLKDTLGGFDERFGVVFGDTDYMERMRAAGLHFGTVIGSRSRHLKSRTCRTLGAETFAAHEHKDAQAFVQKYWTRPDVIERHGLAQMIALAPQSVREAAIERHWNEERFNPQLEDVK